MSDFKSYREQSKTDWGTLQPGKLTIEQINCGSMLRIADAMEKMSVNYIKLQNDYDYMVKSRQHYRQMYEMERRRSAALKGHITKLKNKKP